jgi:nucleotide-binding universal stress UspA family protein
MGAIVKKILAPIDRSKYKEKIIEYAISLGKAWEAEVVAIHVIDPGRGIPGGRIKEKELEREVQATKPAQELLDKVDILAEKEGFHIRKEVVEESDTIGKTIIDYAKANSFNIIIIGTTGMGRIQEMFLGSVANYVIHHAHCPVFAIR